MIREAAAHAGLARAAELHRLQREFAAGGTPALVLTSWLFASAGHDHVATRNVGERTLCLVPPAHVAAARATAHALGYPLGTPAVDRLVDARQSILTIDDQPGWMPRTAASRTVMDGWWDRASVIRVGGQDVRTPSGRDWLLHLALGCGPALRGMDLQSARDITHLVRTTPAGQLREAQRDAALLGLGRRWSAALLAAMTALDAVPPALDVPAGDAPRVRQLALGRAARLRAAAPPRRRPARVEHSLGRFAASSDAAIDAMLTMAEVGVGTRLLDLGCGDGRLVIAGARRGADACGIDCDATRIAEARAAATAAGVSARFITGDVFAMPLPSADVVTLYVAPPAVDPVVQRVTRRSGVDVRVVVHNGRLDPHPPERLSFVRSSPFRVSAVAMWTLRS